MSPQSLAELLTLTSRYKWWLAGIVVFTLSLLVRITDIASNLHWTLDEEFWSLLAYQLSSGRNLPLIGGHIGGTGVYSGPLFVWLTGIIFWLVANDPVRVMVVIGALNALTAVYVYRAVGVRHGWKAGVAAGVLVASSFLLGLYDRKFWNASWLPLLSAMVYWIYSEPRLGRRTKLIAAGFVATLAFQSHMAGLITLLWTFAWGLRRFRWQGLMYVLVIVVVLHIPWMVFEIKHDFLNFKALTALVQDSSESSPGDILAPLRLWVVTAARSLLTSATDRSLELTHCVTYQFSRSHPPIGVYGILLFVATQGRRLSKHRAEVVLLLLSLGLLYGYYLLAPDLFYPGQLAEYFLLPMLPIWLSLVAVGLLGSRMLGAGLIAFLVIVNLSLNFSVPHSASYQLKQSLVSGVEGELSSRAYSLEVEAPECQQYGYLYPLLISDSVPSRTQFDPILGWLYDPDPRNPEVTVSIDQSRQIFSITPVDSDFGETTVD